MNSLAQKSQYEFALVVLNGIDRGATYKLVGSRISIGRGSDNDIVIKEDTKISRNHAVIQFTAKGIEISDVSEHNKVIVNGKPISRLPLKHGAIIQLGETKFQFKTIAANALEPVPAHNLSGLSDDSDQMAEAKPRRMPRFKGSSKSSTNFYILVAVIVLIFGYLLTTNVKKNPIVPIRTDDAVDTEINNYKKIVEDAEAERTRTGTNTRQYEEAQPNFIKGFRDYRKGQYERAIESFQACLALFPDHIQCKHYMNMSQKKFDELIQYHMVLANKYRAQNQFAACKAAYRNAMVMIRNPGHKTYIEAKAGFDACDALEGDRY